MKSLKDIVSNNNYIDGHIHLFNDWKNVVTDKRCVGFADVCFGRPENFTGENMIALYGNYIKNYLNKNTILLATGINAETAIDVYMKFPEIRGFGELKCKDDYHGAHLDKGTLDWVRPVLDFHLPTYVHYDINSKRIEELDELLKEYNTTPVVLCHFGMQRGKGGEYAQDSDKVFELVKDELYKRDNLWCDLSWSAGYYFADHKDKLKELPQDRIFVGTDYNPECEIAEATPDGYINHISSNTRTLASLIDSDKNIYNLFNM